MKRTKRRARPFSSGADAFRLYDTYGFPIDLTVEMAAEEGMAADRDGFDRLMNEQRERARAARAAHGDLAWAGIELGLDNKTTEFTGYEKLTDDATVLAMVSDGEVCSSLSAGKAGIIVLDRTPLYAEMGGQIADHGTITCGEAIFEITDVQKDKGGKYLHHGMLKSGEIRVYDKVSVSVDAGRRLAIMRAHSATHLLQSALREVLGDHVHQAGSYVEPDRLRFDFTHFTALTAEEIAEVERLVQDMIFDGLGVDIREMPIDEARKLGAMALFGEKYGDTVRVVKMGDKSTEFCGGTHLDNTAKAGPFHITSEFSVASGVRRIEAITGRAVLDQMEEMSSTLAKVSETLKTSQREIVKKASGFMAELRELHQTVEKMQAKLRSGDMDSLLSEAKAIAGLKVLTMTRPETTVDELRKMGDFLRDRDPAIVAVLAGVTEGKISILAVCGKDAIAKGVKAGDLIKTVTAVCGGSGGGKPDSAMGGGKDVSKLDDALAAAYSFVLEKVK